MLEKWSKICFVERPVSDEFLGFHWLWEFFIFTIVEGFYGLIPFISRSNLHKIIALANVKRAPFDTLFITSGRNLLFTNLD